MSESVNYAALTKEQIHAAVESAQTIDELARIWTDCARVGWSREGLLYGAILERREQLGEDLSEEDQETLKAARAKRIAGAALPPITGKREG